MYKEQATMNSNFRVYRLCTTRMSLIGMPEIDSMKRYAADIQNFKGLFRLEYHDGWN